MELTHTFVRRIYRVTALHAFAAIVFYLFFQVNKRGPFRDINPFGSDPYDAVGSFAVQIALLIGVLTFARALRLRDDPDQAPRTRFILRGNALVLVAIVITLAADVIAMDLSPLPLSYWSGVIVVELGVMALFTLICIIALVVVSRRQPLPAPPGDLTPADAIDDLWTLVRVPVMRAGASLPAVVSAWVQKADSDWLFGRLPWVNPRSHPWRFAAALGLLAGLGLALAQRLEGPAPSLQVGLLVAAIFIAGELTATVVGFAIAGGYLGLRPSLTRGRSESWTRC